MLPLIAAPSRDAAGGRMTPFLEHCPYIRQVLASFGAPLGRTRLVRLDGGAVLPAGDGAAGTSGRISIHVPIVTQRGGGDVLLGDRALRMAAGEAWVIDPGRVATLRAPAGARRLHLLAETAGSPAFWELVERGEPAWDPPPEDCEPPRLVSWRADENVSLELEGDGDAPAIPAARSGAPGSAAPAPAPSLPRAASRFAHPIFIVCPPRSGSTLLFETLAQSPSVWTVGGESHTLIEGIPKLHPRLRRWESNRLTAADADPDTAAALSSAFLAKLRDRNLQPPPAGASGLRLLEKTPKNALRVPFLRAVFPDAVFVYLYRDPRQAISSMLDAWRSRRFVTYPRLPHWTKPPWSLVLIPGWRSLRGKPLAEIVAEQWATTTRCLLDDLEQLPVEQWCIASYDRLVAEPQAEVERLCAFAGLEWDRRLDAPLPLAAHTLTPPDPDKWKRNAAELEVILPLVRAVTERARELFAHPPAELPPRRSGRPATRRRRPGTPTADAAPAPDASAATAAPPPSPAPAPTARKQGASRLRSSYTARLPRILDQLGASLLVSTYQSGSVVLVRADGGSLNTHFRAFPAPMGIAVSPRGIAIGTNRTVWEYRNVPAVCKTLDPPTKHDACFLPRSCHVTGDIRIHEMAYAGDELWIVNTRFSCLATLDRDHSFVPRWRPRFVTKLAAEDRCHLNGMAVIDGRVRFVTLHAESDVPQGWREHKADGGCIIDVATGETIVRGLSMPHSPRFYSGRLWVLESGKGTLSTVDPRAGKVEMVAELPGFTRGLAFAGPYAFVGLSQVREHVFGGIPLTERSQERMCGVWVVNIRTGQVAAMLRFEDAVQEIFDVQVLAGVRFPELAEPTNDMIANAFVLSREALAET